jgi:NAD(P)-dependent dehydrogenase (short-subunit alcohol dehydrogenase family)
MSKIEQLFSIAGKTALITGGSSGIGAMIARAYVEAGVKVYIASRKLDVCESVAKELCETGVCIPLQADLSSEEGCRKLAAEIGEREASLDILINNAGATWGAPFHEFPAKAWDKVMDLNVKGVFFLTQALAPLLSAAGSAEVPARVINIGSAEGATVPMHENYPYPVSKAAVAWMTQVLAKRLAREHITVNALSPGPFESKMMATPLAEARDAIVALSPLRRIGTPDDIAGAAIYLASPAGNWLTGVNLPVDGGVSTTI